MPITGFLWTRCMARRESDATETTLIERWAAKKSPSLIVRHSTNNADNILARLFSAAQMTLPSLSRITQPIAAVLVELSQAASMLNFRSPGLEGSHLEQEFTATRAQLRGLDCGLKSLEKRPGLVDPYRHRFGLWFKEDLIAVSPTNLSDHAKKTWIVIAERLASSGTDLVEISEMNFFESLWTKMNDVT